MEHSVEKVYTYADLLELDENVRAELICGELFLLPLPSRVHCEVVGELYCQIAAFQYDKSCKVYMKLCVRLFDKDDDRIEDTETLVMPDISVICDHSKLDDAGCKGAPDLIIEVISPSNAKHDRLIKLNLYSRAGVREYWIVSPAEQTVEVLLLDENGKLTLTEVYNRSETARVTVLPGCEIDLSRVFPEINVTQRKKT